LDLTMYLTIYYFINILYRFVLNPEQKELFKVVVTYCDDISGQLPVSFVLGFFVSSVIGRWFRTFMYIPWLNSVTYSVMSAVNCADPRVSRKIRLSVMRYLNLAWILSLRRVSDRVAERFSHKVESTGDGRASSNDYPIRRGRDDLWSVSQQPDQKTPGSKKSRSAKITPMDNGPDNSYIFNFAENTEAFEGTDEWSVGTTLRCFNNDKSRSAPGKVLPGRRAGLQLLEGGFQLYL
uniref:Bestrophin homolog n=1 Tax=Schistocephalus solidus TaxID=70667 RepID=A0A183TDS7_SCHSO